MANFRFYYIVEYGNFPPRHSRDPVAALLAENLRSPDWKSTNLTFLTSIWPTNAKSAAKKHVYSWLRPDRRGLTYVRLAIPRIPTTARSDCRVQVDRSAVKGNVARRAREREIDSEARTRGDFAGNSIVRLTAVASIRNARFASARGSSFRSRRLANG